GLLLALVATAGRVDAAAGGLPFRVGVARPRPEGAFACERDAGATPAPGRNDEGWIMARNILRTGKQTRPKTAVKGKRYRCARCRKRSAKPVPAPAPWYCPKCRIQKDALAAE